MSEDGGNQREVRAALRYLYGAVSALLHGDTDAVDLLLDHALPEVALGDILEAGVLSVAECLRDVADVRGLSAPALVRLMTEAHLEMSGVADLFSTLLAGAATYLDGDPELWKVDQLCELAADATQTLHALTRLLAAALTWRARDAGADPLLQAEHVCLGLAGRNAGLIAS